MAGGCCTDAVDCLTWSFLRSSLGQLLINLTDTQERIFRNVLDAISRHDRFSSEQAPSLFVVYAHDAPGRAAADADRVVALIEWLTISGCTILSDKSPLPLYTRRNTGDDAVRDILSNQMCLLPPQTFFGGRHSITSADKVVLCGSSLLREYYQDAFTNPYLDAIQKAYVPFDLAEDAIRTIVEKYQQSPSFHHVLTELAFLKIRKARQTDHHGVIPVSLDGDDMAYLDLFQHTELRLKSSPNLADHHAVFFKLLIQIYPEAHEFVRLFRNAYQEACKLIGVNNLPVDDVSRITYEEIEKANVLWHRHILDYSRNYNHKSKGTTPGLHNIPLAENHHFVGRQSCILSIKDALFGSTANSARDLAIWGLGGVGKTQIALQIAYWVHKNMPDWTVLWLPVVSREGFEDACGDIGELLDPDTKDAKKLLCDFLRKEKSGQWLLVIDNADDEQLLFGNGSTKGALGEILPRTRKGRVLLTTRYRKIATEFARGGAIEISRMDSNEARGLFARSLLSNHLVQDDEGIPKLLEILTHLPLAITQAAAYLNANDVSVEEYTQLLSNTEHDMMELLDHEFYDESRYGDSPNAVARAWMVSFEQIRKNPAAATFLHFLAHIEPKAIPRSILPKAETEQKATAALGLLSGYNFLRKRQDGTSYDMHRLVHIVTRSWAKKTEDANQQKMTAIAWLQQCLKENSGERKVSRQYMPHVLKALEVSDEKDIPKWSVLECELAELAAVNLISFGRTKEAVVLLEAVVSIVKTELTEKHPVRLRWENSLASAYLENNQASEASDFLLGLLPSREKEAIDPLAVERLLWTRHALSIAYWDRGMKQDSIALQEKILTDEETLPEGSNSVDRRRAIQERLAWSYSLSGRPNDAAQLYEKILEDRKQYGAIDGQYLVQQGHHAIASGLLGRSQEAIDTISATVKKWEEALDESNSVLLFAKSVLATLHMGHNNIEEAIALLEDVVRINQGTLPEGDPKLIEDQTRLQKLRDRLEKPEASR